MYDGLETSGSDIEIVKVKHRGRSGVKVKQKSSVDDTYASTSEEEDFIENPFKNKEEIKFQYNLHKVLLFTKDCEGKKLNPPYRPST